MASYLKVEYREMLYHGLSRLAAHNLPNVEEVSADSKYKFVAGSGLGSSISVEHQLYPLVYPTNRLHFEYSGI